MIFMLLNRPILDTIWRRREIFMHFLIWIWSILTRRLVKILRNIFFWFCRWGILENHKIAEKPDTSRLLSKASDIHPEHSLYLLFWTWIRFRKVSEKTSPDFDSDLKKYGSRIVFVIAKSHKQRDSSRRLSFRLPIVSENVNLLNVFIGH